MEFIRSTYELLITWLRRWWVFNHRYQLLSLFLILAGLYIGSHFFVKLSKNYTVFGDGEVEITKTGAVGDFVAGVIGTIFSLAGFILVYLTYKDQVKANKKDEIETRFFILVQIQVNNSTNISYQNPYNGTEETTS